MKCPQTVPPSQITGNSCYTGTHSTRLASSEICITYLHESSTAAGNGQPAAQSKLRELRQRARSACFVPAMQKMQNNRDFTLSLKLHYHKYKKKPFQLMERLFCLVEIVGVEPTTPCLQSRCSSQLSYTPMLGSPEQT